MQNILLITTIYPLPEGNHGTSVCHYFAREWVKMGYQVRVIHFQTVFPVPFYWLARMNRKLIAAKTGAVIYTQRDKGEIYESEGVEIKRIPLFKPIPHGGYSKHTIRKAIEKITEWNKDGGFEPNIIVGHFPNPQIEVVGRLKEFYRNAATAIVMHGDIGIMQRVYGERLPALLKGIDIWGFRSKIVMESFESAVGKVENPFICYSGIPEQYNTNKNQHNFRQPLRNFVYVGLMIERKYPEKVLEALETAYPNKEFHINYIGEGQQLNVIRQEIADKQLQQQVSILGRIPRDQIVSEYDKADCMVMISRGEAYGLVYLEAMARGCITIASRNEGFDGVIVDGENGFLCKAGDAEELASIIKRINNMTSEERHRVSNNALETAKRLTDEKAAKMYIDEIIARIKQY